jgi:hypothetical protein
MAMLGGNGVGGGGYNLGVGEVHVVGGAYMGDEPSETEAAAGALAGMGGGGMFADLAMDHHNF